MVPVRKDDCPAAEPAWMSVTGEPDSITFAASGAKFSILITCVLSEHGPTGCSLTPDGIFVKDDAFGAVDVEACCVPLCPVVTPSSLMFYTVQVWCARRSIGVRNLFS